MNTNNKSINMESNNDSADFLLSTLSSFKKNLSQCIKQSQNTVSSFNDAMKELTRPLSKINKLVITNIKYLFFKLIYTPSASCLGNPHPRGRSLI